MALTNTDYRSIAEAKRLLVYRVSEADSAGNARTVQILPANASQNVYSIAKAFTVLSVGLCFDRGLLTPETKVSDLLGKYFPAGTDPKWDRVRLHHLLTHKAGYGAGCLDIDAEDARKWGSTDYLSLAVSAPMPYEPGERAQYTDAAFYLVSRMVTEATGKTVADLLRPILFDRMNFGEVSFSVCPRGYSMGATGLYLRSGDTVKLGTLMLRRGDWFGERIVSEEWIDTVLGEGYEFTPKKSADGCLWYGKGGMYGQMLAFSPERDLAVAWSAYGKVPTEIFLVAEK